MYGQGTYVRRSSVGKFLMAFLGALCSVPCRSEPAVGLHGGCRVRIRDCFRADRCGGWIWTRNLSVMRDPAPQIRGRNPPRNRFVESAAGLAQAPKITR